MKKLRLAAAICVLGIILIYPEEAARGGQRAMRLWCTSVAPAVFPFLALMPILTGPEACSAYNRMLSRIVRKGFGLPGAAAPAIAIGMIAGSPGGAIASVRIARECGMKGGDAKRLALAVCGVSPAYLVLGVGGGLFGSTVIGWKLAAIQSAVQVILLIALRFAHLKEGQVTEDPIITEWKGMRTAVETVLVICGYMVLFGSVVSAIAMTVGEHMGTAILAVVDLPSGLAGLVELESKFRTAYVCAAIGFGGLCIGAQNLDVLRAVGVSIKEYLAVRAAAAIIYAGIGLFALRSEMVFVGGEFNISGKYSFSLLIAGFLALPGVIFLTKNLFLNKRRLEKHG